MLRPALPVLWLLTFVPAIQAEEPCAAAIQGFQRIIDSDVQTGNLNKSVHARIGPQLAPVAATCRAGHDAEAIRALQALKGRYGYR